MVRAQEPSRTLIVAGVILIFIIIVALISSIATVSISRKVAREKAAQQGTILPTPKPLARSIYLDLPASFPRDIPLITRSQVTSARESKDDWSAVLLTSTPLKETTEFYLKELPATDWEITNQSTAAGLSILYVRKNAREAIIAIGRGDQGITVSITILKS